MAKWWYFIEKKNSTKKEAESKQMANDAVVVADSEEKAKKRNKLIKWLIALAIIGLFIGLMVWSCVPKYTYIKPTGAKINGTSLEIDTDNDINTAEYTIDLINTNNLEAYYYVTGPDYTTYLIIDDSDRGTIEFTIQVTIDDKLKIGSETIEFSNSLELQKWVLTVESNATIYSSGTNWSYIMINLIPTLLLVGIMVWSFSKIGKMGGGLGGQGEESIFSMGKSQAKVAKSNIRFEDVAGIEEEKAELAEIVDYLKNPEIYAAMGARTPRGVMLYGPPGTGKTLLAKAVAGEASVPFFQASGSSFEDMLVGVGAKRVRSLFQQAKKSAPSIIFIDEIDSVASKRGKNDMSGGGLADQTINQLLAEMDGFNTRTGVVVIAATNRLDVLDDAILRPGRFDRHIQVNLPDIKEREAILKIHSRNKNISTKVKLDEIARRTPGFSGAQLENVLNEATLLAVRQSKNVISTHDIDEAIDRVIAGPSKKTRIITEEERTQIAYHEAGHALVGLHTPSGDVVEKITIIPRGQAAGYTLSTPFKQELAIQKKSDLLAIIRTTLGGRAAELVKFGPDAISTGASNDLYKITNIVRAMVTQLGMSDVGMTQFIPSEGTVTPNTVKLYSDETAVKIDIAIEKIIDTEYKNAINIIKTNSKELDLIVESLLILETIVKSQIDYIHENLKLPEEAITRKEAKASVEKVVVDTTVTVKEEKAAPKKAKAKKVIKPEEK